MDGEVQPKFGLMVSLILMNITAIVLFFFATHTRETTVKNQSARIEPNNRGNVPMVRAGIAEKVMAGDADNSVVYNDENVIVAKTPNNAEVGEGFVSQKKISSASVKDSRHSLAEAQIMSPLHLQAETENGPDKAGMKLIKCPSTTRKDMSNAEENSYRHGEPPLAIALKNFLGETSSGVRIFFDGLKNGYTKKRIRERVSSIDPEPLPQLPIVKPPADAKTKEPSHTLVPPKTSPETTPISIWGSVESESASNQEIISTELLMDILSRTQKRTNELIYVFSKKVIPAIERMNDRVADAVRLEKNLDSYTSALIGAINSVICPHNATDTSVKHKNSKSGTNVVRKLKHTKAFLSDLSLMRDSRIHDYVGSLSKGECSPPNKRPVFKTLAARCWHTTNKRKKRKNKKQRCRDEEITMPEDYEIRVQQSNHNNLGKKDGMLEDVPEQVNYCEIEDDPENGITPVNSPMDGNAVEEMLKSTATPQQCIIGIEDVLALTSKLEQSHYQGVKSDLDVQPFLLPLNINSDASLSSGMVCRSFVAKPSELVNVVPNRMVNEYNDAALNSEQAESPGNTSFPKSDLHEVTSAHDMEHVDVLGSDVSVVCDSRIQGYNSCLAEKENSSVAHSSEKGGTEVVTSSETIDLDSKVMAQQPGKSNQLFSFSGKTENTAELLHVFQRLNHREKVIAVESVCLLVLRIYEAWAGSQSSLGLSRISFGSEYSLSTDETYSQINRPGTAICSPTVNAVMEQKAVLDSIPKESKLGILTYVESGQSSAEIQRDLLQNVIAAAEIQIAERSLMEVKAKVLQNSPLKVDALKGYTEPTNTANQSDVGDGSDRIIIDEEIAASLMSKSHDSIKASKESSAATFYTSQPELSDEAFYECVSSMSAGTYSGSLDLEVQDSSKVFLEKIQEEGITVQQNKSDGEATSPVVEPQKAYSSLSLQPSESEELRTANDSLNLDDFSASDNSSYEIATGIDDEAYPCSSIDLSGDESKADNKPKKKKWAAKFFKKFLKRKSKPSSLTSIPLSKNTSRSQSDSVLKPSDQTGTATH